MVWYNELPLPRRVASPTTSCLLYEFLPRRVATTRMAGEWQGNGRGMAGEWQGNGAADAAQTGQSTEHGGIIMIYPKLGYNNNTMYNLC